MKKALILISTAVTVVLNAQNTTIPIIDDAATAQKIFSKYGGINAHGASREGVLQPALKITSIQNNGNELLINDSIRLKKGGALQIYLPAGKGFIFIQRKKKGFGLKMIKGLADITGTGAAAVGLGSGSTTVLMGASKVMQTANAVGYGADALDRINDLPISNQAKKIAGQKMTILGWELTDDGYQLTTELDKKQYEINLQEAAMAGEIKL